jgi:RHS repeat-associated protein
VGFNTVTNGGTTSYESTISYTYDAGNRMTQTVDSAGGTITEAYDNLDRLTSETTAQGTISYTYDSAGRRTTMQVTGQPQVAYTYDNADRLTQISQNTSSTSFGYDNANRRTSLTLPNNVVVSYGYDNDSRLTGIIYQFGSNILGNLTYAYDQLGRRTQVGGSFARTGLPGAVTSTSYDAANELTNWNGLGISYDGNGNMLSDGINAFNWNARNQVAKLNNISLQYDAFGRRTQNASGTSFLYDGANAAQELSGNTVTASLLSGGIDEIFSRTDSTGAFAPLKDALGSTLALVDSSGNIQTSYTYDPYGGTSVTGTSNGSEFQYTGRENEGNGLYFYRARYYSPLLGRFISEDPLGFGGSGSNFYAYALDSPANLADPSGLESGNLNELVPGPNGEIATNSPLTPQQQADEDAYWFFLLRWKNWIPTHGNWCGPNWSGGLNPTLNHGLDGTAAPVDALDALCQQHDHMYEAVERCRASMDKKHQKICEKMKEEADIWLHDQAELLPPLGFRADRYKWLLLHVAFPKGSPRVEQSLPPGIERQAETCTSGVCIPNNPF